MNRTGRLVEYTLLLGLGVQRIRPVRLAVFDLLGREVAVLIDGELPAGAHNFEWQTDGLSSGVYVVRVETPRVAESNRLTVAR